MIAKPPTRDEVLKMDDVTFERALHARAWRDYPAMPERTPRPVDVMTDAEFARAMHRRAWRDHQGK